MWQKQPKRIDSLSAFLKIVLHFCIKKADKTEAVEKMPLFRRFPIFPRIFRQCVKMFFYTLQDRKNV